MNYKMVKVIEMKQRTEFPWVTLSESYPNILQGTLKTTNDNKYESANCSLAYYPKDINTSREIQVLWEYQILKTMTTN